MSLQKNNASLKTKKNSPYNMISCYNKNLPLVVTFHCHVRHIMIQRDKDLVKTKKKKFLL